jgi:hypothetical protein
MIKSNDCANDREKPLDFAGVLILLLSEQMGRGLLARGARP